MWASVKAGLGDWLRPGNLFTLSGHLREICFGFFLFLDSESMHYVSVNAGVLLSERLFASTAVTDNDTLFYEIKG